MIIPHLLKAFPNNKHNILSLFLGIPRFMKINNYNYEQLIS